MKSDEHVFTRPKSVRMFVILHFFLLGLFIAKPIDCLADSNDSTKHIGFQVSVGMGNYINIDKYTKKFVYPHSSYNISAEINHSALPSDSSIYDSDYNYPLLSLGFRYHFNKVSMHRYPDTDWGMAQEVNYDSHLGN
ncbi:MAG: hypothetical protein IIT94_08895, partial [Prevotella sp.]|nr:hypothetical protein [Prevotella sp.]